MENEVESCYQVQLLETDGCTFELNVHTMARILLHDRVKDKPVAVVAVVGAFRKGKSFLLSFFLRYLRNRGRADWLGEPEAPLKGFEWRGGSQRHTTGIMIWNEVFLVTTSQGKQLAVLLMDTQGAFDCKTSTKVHSVIFVLSALISSVLVYNISQNIQEDDLQHLQLFTEYGRLAQQMQEANREPFQSLLFLVRDWCFPYEANYGSEGGKKVLDERLQISNEQVEELRQLREKIQALFSKVDCFLMPYPGGKVTSQQSFDGRLSDIEEEFKQQLETLVPSLLAPDNLLVKKINGKEITCQELMAYFQGYVDIFKEGRVPAAECVFTATIKASNVAAFDKARDLYMTKMLKIWETHDRVDRDVMQGHHYRLREEAMELFDSCLKMGGEEFSKKYKDGLSKAIDEIFERYSQYMRSKKNPFKDFDGSLAFKAVNATLMVGLGAATIALTAVALPEVALVCAAAGAVSASIHIFDFIVSQTREKKTSKTCNGPAESSSADNANADDTTQPETNETTDNLVNQEREG